MTDTTITPRPLQRIVAGRAQRLQHGYLANQSDAVAALARLRRALGAEPGSILDILDYTYAPEFTAGWDRDEPSWAETAAHHALALYAVHQQSQAQGMHQPGRRLGAAVRQLIPPALYTPAHPIARRFAALSTADSLTELLHHLRGIVQLLRAAGLGLDYGQLAEDLQTWQRPDGPARVRRRWGRDFHLTPRTSSDPNSDAE